MNKDNDTGNSRFFETFIIDLLKPSFLTKNIEWEFNEDKKLNYVGIDGYLKNNQSGKTWITDIKAGQIYRSTFAFELETLDRNLNPSEGWFNSNNKKNLTELYIYSDMDYVKSRQQGLTVIPKVEIFFIQKQRIKEQLANENINYMDYEKHLKSSQAIWKYNNLYYYYNHDKSVYLVYSSTVREQPVNLVITKQKLKEMGFKSVLFDSVDCGELMKQID